MLTQDRLKQLLSYDPDTGLWVWIFCPPPNQRHTGTQAGNRRSDGYLKIRIDGFAYYSSHLACLYMTGKLPDEEMDHEDNDPNNDKWSNLREATSSQNKYNRRYLGLRGVYRRGNKWMVIVGLSNYLGMFNCFGQALIARDAEAKRLGGDFAVLNLKGT